MPMRETDVLAELLQAELRGAVQAEFRPLFAELQRFVDRRIAELSAELHASTQLADMTEERISRELALVHEKIAGLVAMPTTSTRNSGVELEAVVLATEAAANTIMEAAEAIQDWIVGGARDADAIETLAGKVNSIFEACSFQDVTGQRIRRAIQHLQQAESVLECFLPRDAARPSGPRVEVRTQLRTVAAAPGAADLAQAEIDALLNG
jgi:chemotaxis regulatin CheY-phosphate phosphatase CheZ